MWILVYRLFNGMTDSLLPGIRLFPTILVADTFRFKEQIFPNQWISPQTTVNLLSIQPCFILKNIHYVVYFSSFTLCT